MVKIKYVGTGIFTQGIYFKPDKNDGLYEVDEKTANYLLKTFKNDFILIEKKSDVKIQTKRKATRRSRTKKAD